MIANRYILVTCASPVHSPSAYTVSCMVFVGHLNSIVNFEVGSYRPNSSEKMVSKFFVKEFSGSFAQFLCPKITSVVLSDI